MVNTVKKRFDNAHAFRVAPDYSNVYDSSEFNLSTGQTDYDVLANQASSAFVNVKKAHSLIIRSDQSISVRFNSASGASITIDAGEGVLSITQDMGFEITNVYITNASGQTAAIKILLFE